MTDENQAQNQDTSQQSSHVNPILVPGGAFHERDDEELKKAKETSTSQIVEELLSQTAADPERQRSAITVPPVASSAQLPVVVQVPREGEAQATADTAGAYNSAATYTSATGATTAASASNPEATGASGASGDIAAAPSTTSFATQGATPSANPSAIPAVTPAPTSAQAPSAIPSATPSAAMSASIPMVATDESQVDAGAGVGAGAGAGASSNAGVPAEDSRSQDEIDREIDRKIAGTTPVIHFENITKVYPAQPDNPALSSISLKIYAGEFIFLVGHSGSGKSTFIRLINREILATRGRLTVAGEDVVRMRNWRVPYLRRNIGCVFQDFKLLPNKTAFENVAFALEVIGKSKHIVRTQVPEVLRLVGLEDKLDQFPDQLSGGEQQRVSIARAIVNRPPLLICDEPTGNLDPQTSLGIMRLLDRINRTGTTILVATHDREMVDSLRKRVVALENGYLVRDQDKGVYGIDA